MKKCTAILAFVFCIFFVKKSTAQTLDLQMRYFSEIKGFYPRIEADIPFSEKFTLCGGLSKDALQMIDITGTYKVLKNLSCEIGVGYHKQNNLHLIYGISTDYETKKLQINGYVRGYIDHMSLYASEIELLRKIHPHLWIGIMTDVEYGKYFQKWSEVTNTPLMKEKMFLGGLMCTYHITKKIHLSTFMIGGPQFIHHTRHTSYKVGVSMEYHFREHQQ